MSSGKGGVDSTETAVAGKSYYAESKGVESAGEWYGAADSSDGIADS